MGMLASELLARARRVRIHGRGPADAALTGEYRCAFRGSGMEFEDTREYAPGDDVSAIDWKVTARLGRPFVKRFREERQRTVMLVVDVSRSMRFGVPPLLETAAEAAVVLAISCAASRDRVGCLLFSDRVERFVPPGKGPGQAFAVAAALAETVPAGTATDPGPALTFLDASVRRRAILFVFSDFLADGFSPTWGRLAARHDLTRRLRGRPGPDAAAHGRADPGGRPGNRPGKPRRLRRRPGQTPLRCRPDRPPPAGHGRPAGRRGRYSGTAGRRPHGPVPGRLL